MVNNFTEVLARTPLFGNIQRCETKSMLKCLGVRVKVYRKNDVIFFAGDKPSEIGIIMCGKAQVIRDDIFGNRTIISALEPSDTFGEAFACSEAEEMPVSVIAAGDCQVMWIQIRKILSVCSSACTYHSRLISNLMQTLAGKNIQLNEKVQLLSLRTTREKLMHYLIDYAEKNRSNQFTIPFSRSELADYLGVDRSAMSRELGKLRDEGLIRFDRERFELLTEKHGRGEKFGDW